MTVQELLDILDVDVNEDVEVLVNGYDRTLAEAPVHDYEIDSLTVNISYRHNREDHHELTVYIQG